MPWIGKVQYSFNKFIGENGGVVSSISEAKQFKTKKEANEFISKNDPRTPVEVLKVVKNK